MLILIQKQHEIKLVCTNTCIQIIFVYERSDLFNEIVYEIIHSLNPHFSLLLLLLLQGQTQVGPEPHGSTFFIYYIFHFCSWTSIQKPQAFFLINQSNQSNPNNNYLTQKLNKNNKNIHNGNCILAIYIYIFIYLYIYIFDH